MSPNQHSQLSTRTSGVPFRARFTYTHAMVKALTRIEAACSVIDILPLPPDRVLLLRHEARQRATRNSTAIEGNTLDSAEVGRAVGHPERSKSDMAQEVRNYWRALDWIEEQLEDHRNLTENFIRELHAIIIVRGHGRRGVRSEYRKNECPVVDGATRAIDYGPPEPGDVPNLMRDLVAWAQSPAAADLPSPLRAGLLAHRFVSIHPFSDGNGRTARALATVELWRTGYDMRGFLSLEEYYTPNLAAYYGSLQMGLPVNYYEGRHDPDHTRWLEFFCGAMATGADALRRRAEAIHPQERRQAPWDNLHRTQQQLLSKLMLRGMEDGPAACVFGPQDLVAWYGISASTAREWLGRWRMDGFVRPEREDAVRVRRYALTDLWQALLSDATHSEGRKKG
jgi:Fic family protein